MAHQLPARPAFSTSAEGKIVAVVMIHDEILADAQASSGKNARVRASEKALRLLEGMSVTDFRKRFKCSCGHVVRNREGQDGQEQQQQQINNNKKNRMEWQREAGTRESNVFMAEERKRKANEFPEDTTVELESIQKIRLS